ncbi:MAG: hypothetical protein KDB69_06430 [Acidimicrobiia bacterium]|nr:hypothetical protein [Acidimicrobiia bacterium]
MAELQDIPRLVTEFVELAKAYLLQETVEPAKKLGYFAGMSLAATAMWAIGLILLSVAGLRALVTVLPDGPYWQALAYVVFALLLVGFCALVIAVVPDRGVHDGPSTRRGGSR